MDGLIMQKDGVGLIKGKQKIKGENYANQNE